jgi:hypothetical protein
LIWEQLSFELYLIFNKLCFINFVKSS